jgi:2EXR family
MTEPSPPTVSMNPSLAPQILTEFTLFPCLPIELRIKIWRHALPGPRIIEFYQIPDGPAYGGDFIAKVGRGSHLELLRLVKTCRESRDIVEQCYHKVPVEAFHLAAMKTGASFFVNYEQDIFLLNVHLMGLALKILGDAQEQERCRIKTVMFFFNEISVLKTHFQFSRRRRSINTELFKLESLREIAFVCCEEHLMPHLRQPPSPGVGLPRHSRIPGIESIIVNFTAPWKESNYSLAVGGRPMVDVTFYANTGGDRFRGEPDPEARLLFSKVSDLEVLNTLQTPLNSLMALQARSTNMSTSQAHPKENNVDGLEMISSE